MVRIKYVSAMMIRPAVKIWDQLRSALQKGGDDEPARFLGVTSYSAG
jgi:hypothetical protein